MFIRFDKLIMVGIEWRVNQSLGVDCKGQCHFFHHIENGWTCQIYLTEETRDLTGPGRYFGKGNPTIHRGEG